MGNNKIVVSFAVLLAACSPKPDMEMQEQSPIKEMNTQRVTVTRVGVFRDTLAYNDVRGIYVIRDSETGREFIGVSGVGIAETGSHQAGKTSTSDER